MLPGIQEIKTLAREGDTVPISNGAHHSVEIAKLNEHTFSLKALGRENFYVSYARVVDSIVNMNPHPLGMDLYPSALANYIIEKWVLEGNVYEENTESPSNQIKLIQFHPAYSYEDFVRGIVATSSENGVEYAPKNKVLAELAIEAYQNLINSRKSVEELSKENWLVEQYRAFCESIEPEIISEAGYPLSDATSVVKVAEDGDLIYTGRNWNPRNIFRLKTEDIINIFVSNAKTPQEVKKLDNVSLTAKQHATYRLRLVQKFREFIGANTIPQSAERKVQELRYVMIIDEINRANLPAVLGELIYALEYRGENVESMCDIDGERKITLPPNLYIIGTMNTADRSVGHIDYAIRRRFAFVDVLPSPAPVHAAAKNLFKKVSELFVKDYDSIDWQNPKPVRSEYIAPDFRPEDIWIGHSYFMSDKEAEEDVKADLEIKLKYEILPLLKEYIKDGLLLPEAHERIRDLHV